jgi:hypothetical protein
MTGSVAKRQTKLTTSLAEMKSAPKRLCATLSAETEPIKANPSKGGDAKRWTYRYASRDHGRQAAEDRNKTTNFFSLRRAWHIVKPVLF